MAAIFQIRRGSGSVSLVDGELYLHKSSGSLQVGIGTTPITLARLDQPNSGSLNISGDVSASNMYVSGNLTVSGNLFLGNTSSDNISALGVFTTNLVPGTNNLYDVGTNSAKWSVVYANSLSGSLTGSVNGINITTFSESVNSRLDRLQDSTSSLNTFSASVLGHISDINTYTSSINLDLARIHESTSSLNSYTSSQNTKNSTLATYTASLENYTSSINLDLARIHESTSSLNSFSASVNGHISDINTYTQSLKTAIDVTGGNTIILGNLSVLGTTTSLNTTETFIEDKSITLASGSTTSTIADGAGLNIAGANVSMSWEHTNTRLYFNTNIAALGSISASTVVGLNGDSVTVYSTSVDSRLSNLQSKSASVDNSITNLNNVSSSLISKTGSYATTGSNSFIGDQSINGNLYLTGSLIPSGNFVYDLGSSTNGFGDVYLSSSTVYMNNNAIFGTTDVVPVNVGDYLQGGIVYYVDTVNGFSYIVNKDDIGEVSYSNFTRVAGANSSVLGGGITNTNAITASTGGQQNPAKLCSDFTGGGYTDWYLPSTRELALIATNTNLMGASLAASRYYRYWSSTADSNASNTYYAGDDTRDDNLFTNLGYGNTIMYSMNSAGYGFSQYTGKVKAVRRTSITSIIRTLSFPNFNFSGSINVEGTIDGIAIGAFTTQSNERLTDLESSSVNLNIVSSSLNLYTASANTWSGTIDTKFITLENVTSSLISSTASFNTWTGSTYNTFSQSVDSRLDAVEYTVTTLDPGNFGATLLGLNAYTASATIRLNNLEATSASVNTSVAALNVSSASLNSFTASNDNTSLNSYTHSLKGAITISGTDVSIAGGLTVLGTTTIIDTTILAIKDNIIELNAGGGVNGGLVVRDVTGGSTISGSLLWDAQNDRWIAGPLGSEAKVLTDGMGLISGSGQLGNYETTGRGIVSGSSQITFSGISSLPTLVSGSSQINYTGLSGIPGGIVSGSSQTIANLPTGTVSGSSQITYTNISSIPGGIVSGSSQITYASISSIPAGIVSGSSQIVGGSTIHSGSSGDYQFNSIGVGTAASALAGEIRATGDITAFYSSDIRLKENITPIENALEKVESISGNTYDWKEGYDEIHSHKGNDVGVIAQEIEEILPQIVTNRDNGYKAVQYEKIVPLLIEAIKELSEKIKRLENK